MDEVRPLLLDLLEADQDHYGSRVVGRAEIERDLLSPVRPAFEGENVVFAIRERGPSAPATAGDAAVDATAAQAGIVAICWCVLFDPGTGLEGEVAEVYVRPDHRGRGLARVLVARAVELFKARGVTFAAVWTHPDNDAAVRLYRQAGFAPTEQLVMTWLPGRG
jgi:ribosomal protein S18 acetylase RimI-like enzyme